MDANTIMGLLRSIPTGVGTVEDQFRNCNELTRQITIAEGHDALLDTFNETCERLGLQESGSAEMELAMTAAHIENERKSSTPYASGKRLKAIYPGYTAPPVLVEANGGEDLFKTDQA